MHVDELPEILDKPELPAIADLAKLDNQCSAHFRGRLIKAYLKSARIWPVGHRPTKNMRYIKTYIYPIEAINAIKEFMSTPRYQDKITAKLLRMSVVKQ